MIFWQIIPVLYIKKNFWVATRAPVRSTRGDKKCTSMRIMLFERLGAKTVHSHLDF
jgi:hypothetical protein